MLTIPDTIKDLLHLDSCQKNIRINFPSMVRSDICNDLIVKDSVSFKESLCSQNKLKFGLCEAPIFECETVGVGNVKGEQIQVYCEVFCDSSVSGAVWQADLMHYVYQIPMGVYTIDSCQRQADMNHRKIVAYGKASSLDAPNEILSLKERISLHVDYYEPDAYNSFLMKANLTGRIPGATYTNISYTHEEKSMAVAYIPASPTYIYLYMLYVRIPIPENSTYLYFADYTRSEKTRQQIEGWLRPLQRDYDKYFKTFIDAFDPNCMFLDWSDSPQPFVPKVYYAKGKYVDAYKIDSKPNSVPYSTESYICIPVGLNYHGNKFYFRDPDEQYFYTVALPSNVPTYKMKYLYQNAYKWGGVTYYATDPIDYVTDFKSAVELTGQFAYITRADGLALVNLKRQFGLTPGNNLKPGTNVYPQSVTGGRLLPEDYESCWYDDGYTLPYGKITVKYKDTGNHDNEFNYYLVGYDENTPPETYQVYDLSDIDIIKNGKWTENQISTICGQIANNISNVSYMPVQFTGRGLPYVEAGDTFEILTSSGDSITTIVLNKTTKGELHLVDEYTSV